MTSNHKYFESLCALAISDELTGPELVELHAHSLECVSCRDRIHEMTKIDACLLLSPAFTRQNARLPKGMRERFIARAIKEGVPLNSPSTAGLGNLGLASALFIILLVTAAAIRTGPFSRPVVDASHFDAAQLANPVRVASLTPPGSTMNLRPGRKDRSRDARSRSVVFQWRPDPSSGFQARKRCWAIWSLSKIAIFRPHSPHRITRWQRCRRTLAGCQPGPTRRRDSG
jgi:hypothetical protein